MLAETDLFRQEFEIAAQQLEFLRQQWALLLDQPDAPHPPLEGMAEALLALKQAHNADLSRQNQACADRCQGLETELAHYRDLFENAPHARLQTDLNATIQAANAPTSILFRTSQDALVGEQLAAFLPEQVRKTLAEHLAQLQAGEALHGWEVCLQPASGDRVEVSLDAVPVPGPEHRLVALQWSVRDISRQVQAEEALRQNEHLLRSLVEGSFDGIALTDEQGQVIEWNQAMESITGLPATAIIGRPIWEVQLQLDDASDTVQTELERCRQGIKKNLDFEFRRKDGTRVLANLHTTPIFDASGAYAGAMASVRDITKEREANDERGRLLAQVLEERRRTAILMTQTQRQADELGAFLNAIPDPVAVWDTHGDVIKANPAALSLGIGPAKSGMVEVAAQLEVRHPNGRPISADELPVARALRGEVIRDEAEILVSPDGEEHEILVSVAPVFSDGAIVACVVVSHDITDKRRTEKERERLLAENRSQREFLERLVETAPVGIAVLRGPEHRYELVNPYYQRITGVPDTPMVGRTIVEVIPDLVNRRMPQLMDEVYRTGMTVSTRGVKLSFGPGREETYWNTDRVPLHGPEGSVEGILVLAREVTEEVKSRERIEALSVQARRQAAEMAAVFTALVEPVMVFDAQGRILTANPAAIGALGVDPVNLPESELARRLTVRTPDGRPIPPADLVAARALLGEEVRDVYQLLVTSGDERAIVAGAAPIGAGDQIQGAVVAWHDITDLKRTEEALRKANERLEFTQTAAGIGAWDWDIPSGRLEWSSKMYELFGLDPRTTVASLDAWRSALHPEDRETAEQRINDSLEAHSELDNEYRVILPDGQIRWISALGRGAYDEHGRPIRMSGICLDITKRKQIEETLRTSEEKYRLLFQNMEEGFALYELIYDERGEPTDWRVLEVNDAYVRHTGLARDQIVGRRISELFPAAISEYLPRFAAVVTTQIPCIFETYAKAVDRHQRIVTFPAGGHRFASTIENVTERKLAEKALADAETKLDRMLQTMLDGMVTVDLTGRIIYANRGAEYILEIHKDELLGTYFSNHEWQQLDEGGHPIPLDQLPLAVAMREQRDVDPIEHMILASDGHGKWLSVNAAPLFDEDGHLYGAVAGFRDITERKRAESALREAHEQLQATLDTLPDLLFEVDRDGRVYNFHAPQPEMPLFPVYELLGRTVNEVLPAEASQAILSAIAQTAKSGKHSGTVYPMNTDTGRHWYELSIAAKGDPGNSNGRFLMLARDITSRVEAESALRKERDRMQTYLNIAGVIIIAMDADQKVTLINTKGSQVIGYPEDEILGAKGFDIFIPERMRDPAKTDFARLIAGELQPIEYAETPILTRDGEERLIAWHNVALRDEAGHTIGTLSSGEDITDQRRALEALRASEALFATVFSFSPDGIGILREDDGIFLDVNEALTSMLGFSRSEIVGRTWQELNIASETEEGEGIKGLFREKEQLVDREFTFTTRQGRVMTVLVSLVSITVNDEPCILAIGHDISERRQSEEALRRAQAVLEVSIQERAAQEERQRLARELHDSVSQALYGVSLGINTALTLLGSDQTRVLEALHYALSLTRGGLAEMRALIFELRPESLAQEGLRVALTKLADAAPARHGFEIELDLCDEPDAPLGVKEALYRITQEALHNAVKHAHASRLDVRMTCAPDSLMLEVCDNGEGFDPLAAYPGHLGLRSMRERALLVGGTLDIVSAKSCGTQIRAHIPLAAPA